MENDDMNKRRHARFQDRQEIKCSFVYDVDTQVDVEVKNKLSFMGVHERFIGYTRNLSAEGICFVSEKRLEPGQILMLEVHLPDSPEIVKMEGEVKWSKDSTLERVNNPLLVVYTVYNSISI